MFITLEWESCGTVLALQLSGTWKCRFCHLRDAFPREFVRWLLRAESVGCDCLPSCFQSCDLNMLRFCLQEFFQRERGLDAPVSKETDTGMLLRCVKRWAFRKVTEVVRGESPSSALP